MNLSGNSGSNRKGSQTPPQGEGQTWPRLLSGLVPDRAERWKAAHQGLEYQGEVILAQAWHPGLGAPLPVDSHFRIVLLASYHKVAPDSIADERIAVCLPAPAARRVAEGKGAYRTGDRAGGEGPPSAEVGRYASGAMVSRGTLAVSLEEVFSSADAGKGLNLIASHLLDGAYRALWNRALPCARLIEASLEEADRPQDIARHEAVLTAKLKELDMALERARSSIEDLVQATGSGLEPEAEAARERLSHLAHSQGYLGFYSRAQSRYATPQALADDMARWQRLQQVGELAPEALEVKRYLDGVVLRQRDEEMALDRLSILGQLSLDNLLANPGLWPSVKALFQWFKSRYSLLYQGHHADYHRKLASLRLALDEAVPELEALSRLNSIVELGRPVGEPLAAEYQLLAEVKPCPLDEEGRALVDREPVCSACGLTLTAQPPTRRVEGFLSQLRQALSTQQRRLSSAAIQQILESRQEARLDQLIKIIQTSDLSSLVKVIDDDLVAFLRDLLSGAASHTEPCTALSDLAHEFAVIEEEQIDQVVAELAANLRSAFSRARKQHPSKRIRLALERPRRLERGDR